MAFADGTSRIIKEATCPVQITLAGTVAKGDPLGYSAGTGWVRADANAGVPAELIAGADGVSGDKIPAYKDAIIDGFSGGADGTLLYLSDTAGGYATTASTTSEQLLGRMVSATRAVINIQQFRDKLRIPHNFAAAGVANIFFIADRRVRVTQIQEVHATIAGQAGTLTVERLQGTEAPAAGDDLLGATKINLEGTINTVVTPALTATVANLVLEKGDRLALKLASGVATSLANACITVQYENA